MATGTTAPPERTPLDLLLGKPLSSDEDSGQRIGPTAGIPIFGLDALSSAAYGPEAAMTILLPLGVAGIAYVWPITAAIACLLAIVYLSYRQTIDAYPTGGGSYTVARENLGARFGLLAGTALMIDYLLNVAVGISSGVGALVSAFPTLQPFTVALCIGILLILTLVNLRGVRDTGLIFMFPTSIFVVCLLGAIAIGLVKWALSGGHPMPVVSPPKLNAATTAVGAWLLVKAFASGCTAMTGVEAVSNGVQAFREPVSQNARKTLTVIIGILTLMLLGIAFLARVYHIGATPPGEAGYQSVLSQLVGAVAGRGIFYYVTIGSILVVLALSANTSFADFPRLCRVMAQDRFLPYGFALRGRRLVYSYGVYSLAILAALLLIIFGGVTDRLIPLFAIGAFMSFTLSQAGMVAHWKKRPGRHAKGKLAMNAIGALATGLTTLVVVVAKFTDGAWITILLIPVLIILMLSIRRHYRRVGREIANPASLDVQHLHPPLVVVPIDEWNKVAQKAVRFAMTLSDDVRVLHIDCGEKADDLSKQWQQYVSEPAQQLHRHAPELVVLRSPYRFVVAPILKYVFQLEREHKDRYIAVVVSELVEKHWYQYILHNQRAKLLTALLLVGGDRRIIPINVPWYLTA